MSLIPRGLAAFKTLASSRGEREGYGGPRDVTSLSLSLAGSDGVGVKCRLGGSEPVSPSDT